MKKASIFILFLLSLFTYVFSLEYHAMRITFEYNEKNLQMVRYEEVYFKDGNKIVFVKFPKKITWVKLGEKFYLGESTSLNLSPPIKDLEDIFCQYLSHHKISPDFEGEILISEKNFTLKAEKENGFFKSIIRKFKNILTEMQYIYLPLDKKFEDILSNFKLVDKSEFPDEIYNILNKFLWFHAKVLNDILEIYAIDKDGEEVELLLSKKSGEFKVGKFYITIKKATEKTRKEIENEVSNIN